MTIYAGTDSILLTRVLQKTDNLDVKTIDIFDPIIARFVKIVFDVIDRFSSTVVCEIEIYGVGYLSYGEYYSKVILPIPPYVVVINNRLTRRL